MMEVVVVGVRGKLQVLIEVFELKLDLQAFEGWVDGVDGR